MVEIKFNKSKHTYKLGKMQLTPVTNVLKLFFGDIDSRALARKVNKIPNSKYYKMGIRKILKQWKEKTEHGSLVHKEIEDYILTSVKPTTKKAKQAVKYLESCDFIEPLFLPEVIVYNEQYEVAGTIDLMVLDENDMSVTLIDWKTNEKIADIEYQKMENKVSDLKNTTLQKYQMQLSIYAWMLRENGNDINEIRLVHLNEEEKPKVYILPILYEEAEYMLKMYKIIKDLGDE